MVVFKSGARLSVKSWCSALRSHSTTGIQSRTPTSRAFVEITIHPFFLPDIIIFSTEEHQSQEPQPNSTFIQDYFSQNLQHVAQHAQFEVERTRLRNAANQPYVAPRKRHTSAALPRSHLEKFFLSSHPELDRLLLSRASFVKSVLCSEPGLWTL